MNTTTQANLAIIALFSMILIGCHMIQFGATEKFFHIIASSHDPCPKSPCLILSQFAANCNVYLDTNTTLIFQPGIHALHQDLAIANVSALLMISDLTIHAEANITIILQLAKIHLRNINLVNIRALNFTGIGGNVIESVDQFLFEKSSFTGGEKMIGTALKIVETNAVISRSFFRSNRLRSCIASSEYNVGGAVIAHRSNLIINESEFEGNSARMGGAIFISGHVNGMSSNDNSTILGDTLHPKTITVLLITRSKFCNNYAKENGGAIFDSSDYSLKISRSQFTNNTSSNGGAISKVYHNKSTIRTSRFDIYKNSAVESYGTGGPLVVSMPHCTVIIVKTTFINNIASHTGGAAHITGYFDSETKLNFVLKIFQSNFTHNLISTPSGDGSALSVWYISSIHVMESEFSENGIINGRNVYSVPDSLHFGVEFIHIFMSTAIFNNTFSSNNKGSLSVIKSSITFLSNTTFIDNHGNYKTSGAITSYQSHLFIHGNFISKNNHARNGGAMHAIESTIDIYGHAIAVNNSASNSGGALYLYQTRLDCKINGTLNIIDNIASEKGGGVHAISSTISLNVLRPWTLLIRQNTANMGGGLYFEMNALLYIFLYFKESPPSYAPIITRNRARYGGAVYMADFETCLTLSQSTIKPCFLQVESIYHNKLTPTVTIFLNISENYAEAAGSAIYGGLLNRCSVNPWYEPVTDLVHIANITNIHNLSSISSEPVGICFCREDVEDCNYQPPTVRVMKGETFILSLVAVDQVNRTIKAYISSHLSTEIGGLGVDQLNRSIGDKCTKLNYNAYSPHARGQLNLYAEGPCKDTAQSVRRVHIIFNPCKCPIGFQPLSIEENHTTCECVCDLRLWPHITECNNQTRLLKRNGNFWVTYINEMANTSSGGFLIYPDCPLDYCKPSTPALNFSLQTQDDIDEQCADNRSGMLCGTCLPGFSLSLGSSRCIQCPSNWSQTTALTIIAALLAGIALVALLLILNLTVAVGTLNGIIFYANVVYATSNSLFPYSTQNFLTVFIAWLNLDIGFDTCFFEGMDTYWKTLIHLAFPVYVICVVIMVIFISEYSTRFSRLIGRKNPVAMLATLILLSYTKLLRIIIASLSFAVLDYPDGAHKVVWLPDATVEYLRGKHIFLFILAILIFLTGTFFTLILLFWQCLIHFQNKVIFRWTRFQKLRLFLEPYQAPYEFKHRYWTGLLLFVRSVLYLIISVSHNPNIRTLVVAVLVFFLLLILPKICYSISGHLYRNFILNLLELVVYMNLVLFSIIKLYALGLKRVDIEIIVAYVSGSVIFALFVAVLVYHTFTEIIAKTKIWKMSVDICHWPWRPNSRENIIDNEPSNRLSRTNPTFSEIGRPSSKEKPLSALIESESEGAANNSTDMEIQCGHQLDTRRHSSFSDESVDSTTALLDEQN